MTSPAPAAARLRTPGELAAAVPSLLGFVPAESLVLVCLTGPRSRVVLVARVDLPERTAEARVVRQLVDAAALAGSERVAAVVVTEVPGALPRAGLVRALRRAAAGVGLGVEEVLLLRGGRWRSYDCSAPGCCPPAGTPVPPVPDALAARVVLAGRAVLPSRQALVAALAPPRGPRHDEALRVALGVEQRLRAEQERDGRERLEQRLRGEVLQAAQAAAAEPGAPLPVGVALRLALALERVPVRDAVLATAVQGAVQAGHAAERELEDGLLALLLAAAPRVPPPRDASLCTALAALALVRGDGALTSVALDRALASDPGSRLAGLLRVALDAVVPPQAVREALSGAPPGPPGAGREGEGASG